MQEKNAVQGKLKHQQADSNKWIIRFLVLVGICLNIKYIFVDFGIDSEFQISMAYRLATGDIMFKEMWEAYQMSAFLCAFFIKIYLAVFKTTTGIVLYLQLIGVLIDAAIAYLLYRVVNKYSGNSMVATLMSWVFFVVSPKDVPLPEYANMQLWFSMLLCISIYLYYKTGRKVLVIMAALCLCGAVLAYPSCMIMLIGVGYLFLRNRQKKELFVFSGTCFGCGLLYLMGMFRHITPDEFLIFFENMLALETSHSAGVLEKFLLYGKDAVIILAIFAVVYVISYGVCCLVVRKKSKILTDMIFLLFILAVSFLAVFNVQEHTRYGYSLVFLTVIIIGIRYGKMLSDDMRFLYLCGTVLSVLNFLSTLLLTDLVLIGSVPYLLIAVIMAFLPISAALNDPEVKAVDKKKVYTNLKRVVLVGGILLLVFRNVYLIRPMYQQTSTILDIRGIVKQGPAIGIVSEYMGPYMQNESVEEWKEYIEEGSNIWIIGDPIDTLGYLYLDTKVSAPSTVCTPGYNESVLKYFEMNPHKYPDVVIASCWYGEMNIELVRNGWILEWLEEEFQPSDSVDGKYWRYYFK